MFILINKKHSSILEDWDEWNCLESQSPTGIFQDYVFTDIKDAVYMKDLILNRDGIHVEIVPLQVWDSERTEHMKRIVQEKEEWMRKKELEIRAQTRSELPDSWAFDESLSAQSEGCGG